MDRIKHEYIKTNVTTFSGTPQKLTFKLFLELVKIHSLVGELSGALTMNRERPLLFSHKSNQQQQLWDLHKADMEQATSALVTEVKNSKFNSVEELINWTINEIKIREDEIMRDKLDD